jgi:hypothetical protein
MAFMATTKPALASDVTDIQERMAQIRHQMHQEVRGAVKGAVSLTDWRSMVANHPWASLGIAAAVGYLIVPRSAHPPQAMVSVRPLPEGMELSRAHAGSVDSGRKRFRPLAALGNLLVPVAIRAAQNYVLNHVEEWLAAHPPRPGSRVRETAGTGPEQRPEWSEIQGSRYREPR